MKIRVFRVVAMLCALAVAAGAALQLRQNTWTIRAEDSGGHGRPDVWRVFDRRGQLIEIDFDTNRDGKADVQEYYRGGVLLRRDSDRNFNGQVDFVEEFDPRTHERVRTLTDIDNDGIADILVLFQHGRPVFSKRVVSGGHSSAAPIPAAAGYGRLLGLADPFQSDTSVRGLDLSNSSHTPFDGPDGPPVDVFDPTSHVAFQPSSIEPAGLLRSRPADRPASRGPPAL